MWVRKLVNELLVAGPFLMLAIMAIRTRTNYDPWETPQNSSEMEARISAYVKPMRAFTVLGERSSPEQVREIAHIWIEGAERGELKDLPPSSYVDSIREGVKGQVASAKAILTYRLLDLASNEIKSGDIHQALLDSTMAYKMAEVLKYSDFSTVYETNRAQLKILRTIEPQLASASPEDRRALRQLVIGQSAALIPLNRILNRTRALHVEALRARGIQSLPIEDVQHYAIVGSVIQTRYDNAGLKEFRKLIVASNGEMPRILTTAKLAWQVENERQALAHKLIGEAQ